MLRNSVLLAALALAGCGAPETQVVDTSCSLFRMIYPTSEDHLSDGTAKAILRHDEVYSAHCPVSK